MSFFTLFMLVQNKIFTENRFHMDSLTFLNFVFRLTFIFNDFDVLHSSTLQVSMYIQGHKKFRIA